MSDCNTCKIKTCILDYGTVGCDNAKEAYQQGRADKYNEITSEYMLLTEKQVADIRADAIEEVLEDLRKWLWKNDKSAYHYMNDYYIAPKKEWNS